MEIRIAEILFKDKPVGSLEETATGGTRFVYDREWNEDIACCFPVTRREHEWSTGLHPFFEHLGPEGWLREEQARGAHIAEEDDLGLLLQYGADCIGAVGVRPKGNKQPTAEIKEATTSPGRTISGIQKKLLAIKDGDGGNFHPAGPDGLAPYIAKFNSERVDSLVRNEALSLRWTASVLGKDEVNTFEVGQVVGLNEQALIVTRFDRAPDGEKLRLEDFAQILCKPRGRDYAGKYNAAYEDVADVIKTHSVRSTIDLARFFHRIVVFTLVGNCDAHLKNFSLLETGEGLRLAPAYDVVNTAIYETFDQTLALSINGNKVQLDEVTRPVLEEFGLSIGLPAKAVDQAFDDIRREVGNAQPIIAPPAAEPPDGFVTRFEQIVSRACLRILAE
jgi:serine/threonine-protein kinase HipA